MKRLTFKTEFKNTILSGEKCATARWSNQRLTEGDIVAAVTKQGTTPAFLVPAKDRFATLRITFAGLIAFKEMTPDRLAKTTVKREWYLNENPTAHDFTPIYYYEFEVAEAQ